MLQFVVAFVDEWSASQLILPGIFKTLPFLFQLQVPFGWLKTHLKITSSCKLTVTFLSSSSTNPSKKMKNCWNYLKSTFYFNQHWNCNAKRYHYDFSDKISFISWSKVGSYHTVLWQCLLNEEERVIQNILLYTPRGILQVQQHRLFVRITEVSNFFKHHLGNLFLSLFG